MDSYLAGNKMFKLRKVRLTSSGLIINRIWKNASIPYSTIQWVSQAALLSPTLIRVSYRNPTSGKLKRIMFIPSFNEQMFTSRSIKKGEMANFLREQVVAYSGSYNKKNEPSKWNLFIILLLPILFIMICFKLLNLFYL